MKTEFIITKDQILKIHECTSCSNMDDLEEWFPEAFKKELENGKVYKHKDGWIAYKKCYKYGFGFDKDNFFNDIVNFTHAEDYSEYPLEDFKKLLIAEAEKRGFKSGVWVDRKELNLLLADRIFQLKDCNIKVCQNNSEFWICCDNQTIMYNGIWAKIID